VKSFVPSIRSFLNFAIGEGKRADDCDFIYMRAASALFFLPLRSKFEQTDLLSPLKPSHYDKRATSRGLPAKRSKKATV